MIQFPDKKYNIIYADPPWKYTESGTNAKVEGRHYPSMSLEEICAMPINTICADKCILFLWATFPRLKDALATIEAWGFVYHSLGFDWTKLAKNGAPKMGCGYYTRQNNEICLIAVPKDKKRRIAPLSHSVRACVQLPAREHSRKPDEIRDWIVEICGDLPRIELFARQRFDGWDAWGNEV